jgi:hypothetical protein
MPIAVRGRTAFIINTYFIHNYSYGTVLRHKLLLIQDEDGFETLIIFLLILF